MQPNKAPTVLIADDNSLMRDLLAGIVKDADIDIIFKAANGLEALKIYSKQRPDIVFLDIQMPDKDGLTVLKEIRELNAEAYVVMVSAHSDAENVKTAIDAGAKGFIVKPYKANRIIGIINRFHAAAG